MVALLRKFIAPLSSIALLMVSTGFFLSFVSLHLELKMEMDSPIIGLVHGFYYIGIFLGAFCSYRFIVSLGHLTTYSLFACINGISIFLMALLPEMICWSCLRFLAGLSIAGNFVVIQSWILSETQEKDRSSVIALYMTAIFMSQGLSQLLLPLLIHHPTIPFVTACILSIFSVVPLYWSRNVPKEPLKQETSFRIWTLCKEFPLGTIVCLIAGITRASIMTFLPNVAHQGALSVSSVMSSAILGGMIFQWPMGRLVEILGNKQVLLVGALGLFFPSLALFELQRYQIATELISFILGGFAFTLYPISISLMVCKENKYNMTTLSCFLIFINSIGAFLGPLIAPNFMLEHDFEGLFIFLSLLAIAIAILGTFALWNARLKENLSNAIVEAPGE